MAQGDKSSPYFVIYVDNSRISTELEAAVKEVTVIDRINNPSKFMITFKDTDGTFIDSSDIFVGSKVKIQTGYKDDVHDVFQGEVTGLIADFSKVNGRVVTYQGYDVLHKLNRAKRQQAYMEMSYKDVISQLMSDASVSGSCCSIGSAKKTILQSKQTDLEFIQDIADRYDLVIKTKQEKVSIKEYSPNTSEDVVVEWGKTLIRFEPNIDSTRVFTDAKIHSWDKANIELVSSEKTASDSNSDFLKLVNQKFGAHQTFFNHTDISDINTLDNLALKSLQHTSRKFLSGRGIVKGNPEIKAGSVIKINGLPQVWCLKYFVVTAKHYIKPDQGYSTEFEVDFHKSS